MLVTEAGAKRLETLQARAGKKCIGFLFKETIGSCRGSTPILKPVKQPVDGATEIMAGSVRFYALGEYADILRDAVLDFDGTLFGKGLTVTWPHREGGCPGCR